MNTTKKQKLIRSITEIRNSIGATVAIDLSLLSTHELESMALSLQDLGFLI